LGIAVFELVFESMPGSVPVERAEVFIGLIRGAQALPKSSSPEGSA
jgi:hypothetical protein